MHMSAKLLGLLAILGILFAAGTLNAGDIKARMLERLPVIVDLKARGVVGENNQGYLEMLKGQTEKQDLVAAENLDRRTVYEQIARQTNTNVQVVGQRRALQIAERASAGEWLQDTNGNWYQK
jgi:uncharacterized protein